jgi:3-methyladenine DNA glycosylase/8-oxoguanine DNA glycosylase
VVPTSSPAQRERYWRPGFACDVGLILSGLRRGAGDPAFRRLTDGTIWWACRTPEGTATTRLRSRPSVGEVEASAWGDGSTWVLDRLPLLLGDADDPTGFCPSHPLLREAQRRFGGWRVPCTGLVFEAILPAVIEQKVTGQEAWLGWRRLLRQYGETAPGPMPGMRVPPAPGVVRAIPSWEWLRMHVDPGRSRTAVTVARVAAPLERTVGLPGDEVERRLRSLPGVGRWTAAEVRQRAHGDADAVSFGDYHVARDVGWALTGTEADDDMLAELLEPYRPHRYRVQRLVELGGTRRPRRGPRMPPRRHLPG